MGISYAVYEELMRPGLRTYMPRLVSLSLAYTRCTTSFTSPGQHAP